MTGIVVVGSINADLNLRVERHPGPGETLIGADGSVTPGGKGANQAVAARRLGAEVRMVGAVGDDAHAGAALSLLEECGVGVDTVSTSPGTPTGLAVVTVDEHGENTIVVVPGANTTVDSAAVGAMPLCSRTPISWSCRGRSPAVASKRRPASAVGG